jgi:zinc protease
MNATMIHNRLLLPAFGAFLALGQTPAPKPIQIPIGQFKLNNGLRVALSEDHSAPTFSLSITYNAGAHDERPGHTGFAHLFEHMMFQGSEKVGKGEHFLLVLNNGGDINGTTTEDYTNYFEAFPANQLDLGLFLEADRMRSLAINQTNLDNQRNAVQEERRAGVDNQAYGLTFEAINETAYDNFANKHSVFGSMKDLNAATVEDIAGFFRTYYAPNNAVVTLVGDFKTGEALTKIEKYFGSIPKQPDPPAPDLSEPPQKGERRKTIEDGFAHSPRIDIVYKVPAGNTPDWHALNVLGSILGSGQSSRLYQTLVKDKELATEATAGVGEHSGPSLFSVGISVRPGKDLAETEKTVYAEIEKIKGEAVAGWELEKIHMATRRNAATQMQGTLFRAALIGQMAVMYNDPDLINTRPAKLQAVTRQDLQRVARAYLNPDNRTVITTLVKAKETLEPAAPGNGGAP